MNYTLLKSIPCYGGIISSKVTNNQSYNVAIAVCYLQASVITNNTTPLS
jgi:hypothetical protein